MAKAVSVGFDELDAMFRKLADENEAAAKRAVNAATPILEAATRATVAAVSSTYGTGRLAASFAATPAKRNDLGVYSVVRPVGSRDGHDYAERASWLEYGAVRPRWAGFYAGKTAPHPWRSASVEAARSGCEAMIEQIMEEFFASCGGE